MRLLDFLRLPDSGADLDGEGTVAAHTEIIRSKPLLRRLYADFYRELIDAAGERARTGTAVEIGSGAGFLKGLLPNCITTDVVPGPAIDLVCRAEALPFEADSLDALFMLNVLHHLQRAAAFFTEADRCLKSNARLVMIEPANTIVSRFFYQNLHHEKFEPEAPEWNLAPGGRLSQANGALPWIIFERDRQQLQERFPRLRIEWIRYHTPISYLIAGGLTFRQMAPGWSYPVWHGLERLLSPLNSGLGLFETVVLTKNSGQQADTPHSTRTGFLST